MKDNDDTCITRAKEGFKLGFLGLGFWVEEVATYPSYGSLVWVIYKSQ